MNPGLAGKFVAVSSIAAALLGFCGGASQAATPPSTEEIVQKAVARAEAAQAASNQRDFTYTKVTVIEELDSTGNVKERKEKLYQVLFQGGATHLKLLQVNGHDPAEADMKKMADN